MTVLVWIETDGGKAKPSNRSGTGPSKRNTSADDSPTSSGVSLEPLGAPKTPPPIARPNKADEADAPKKGRGRKRTATAEPADTRPADTAPSSGSGKKRRGRGKSTDEAANANELNDRLTFLAFVNAASIGDTVDGIVETFSSHGCYVRAAGAQCYLPSKSMGEPPPQKEAARSDPD